MSLCPHIDCNRSIHLELHTAGVRYPADAPVHSFPLSFHVYTCAHVSARSIGAHRGFRLTGGGSDGPLTHSTKVKVVRKLVDSGCWGQESQFPLQRPAKSEANKMKDLILVGSYSSSRLQISSPASRKKDISQEPCLLNWIQIPWKAETLEAPAERRDESFYLSPFSSSATVFISRWLQISCIINSKTISWKRFSLNWLQVKRSSEEKQLKTL